MTTLQAKIPPFDYIGGKEFTENLKNVANVDTFLKLADVFGIPRTTITTWNTHDRTSFELIVRAHLATGASVRYMALGEGEAFENNISTIPSLKVSKLVDGALLDGGKINLDEEALERFGLTPLNTQIIEDDSGMYYINKESTDPVSGDYLLDVDGRLSINNLQRLPGKKLAIAFGSSTIEVSEEDVKVVGRVAMEMKKK
ncbi:helix-turn-helix domain-containing protein [Aliivibrio fischeri]|uniref:helix-turn-helix domain-containing protein n=1 Tax=Aliivibrio fischeri TaxID=668 RepID=UPI0012DA34CE|nr:helix-turn-helix domain-containing protein [Aliivibrio fischeri]